MLADLYVGWVLHTFVCYLTNVFVTVNDRGVGGWVVY